MKTKPNNYPGGRGRSATKPSEIPATGWKDIALRIKAEVAEDRVGFSAAAITFYLLIGLVPLLAAFVGAYGLVADPSDVADHVRSLAGILPSDVLDVVRAEMLRVAEGQDSAGISLFIGLALALWGGAKATDALIVAMNIAYDESESRTFVWRKLVSLSLTFVTIIFLCIAVTMLAGIPAMVSAIYLPAPLEGVLSFMRWPLLFLASMLWLSVFYCYAPCRSNPKWRWVSWGAFIATLLWVASSAGFSFYVANFGNYSGSYGSLGAIIVLMMWCFISGFCAMLGAEVNAEMEHQTRKDTTAGVPEPMGQRGAYVADDLGKSSA